jgi:hypothetical protein
VFSFAALRLCVSPLFSLDTQPKESPAAEKSQVSFTEL